MKKIRGVYEHPPGSRVFWAQYFIHGKRYRERAGTQANAKKLYDKRKVQAMVDGKLPELSRQRVTVAQLADLALAYARQHNSSYKDYVTRAALLKAALGPRTASEVTPDEIEEWIESREGADATFNRYRAFVSLCYREGMRKGKVKANIASLVPQRRESRARKRYLSRPEYATLLGAIPEHHREEFVVSVFTGMRRGEQYTVTWDQFDAERGELNLTRTKNGEDRTVSLTSEMVALLAARKQRLQPKRNTPIFPRRGHAFSNKFWFDPALKAAGIEGYVWHSNRHTFCSWLAIAGVPLKTIQELAGHKTIAITAQYAHLCPDHKRAEIEKISLAPSKPRRRRQPAASAQPLQKSA